MKVVSTARVVCGAVSMQLSGVCLSVCLSHPASAAGLLLWAGGQQISIDCYSSSRRMRVVPRCQ